jgi:hypothetical protein
MKKQGLKNIVRLSHSMGRFRDNNVLLCLYIVICLEMLTPNSPMEYIGLNVIMFKSGDCGLIFSSDNADGACSFTGLYNVYICSTVSSVCTVMYKLYST